jgi:hypothetical protein
MADTRVRQGYSGLWLLVLLGVVLLILWLVNS